VKDKSGCDRGCRRFEFSWRDKTLFLKEEYAGRCEPDHVHTWNELLIGYVHMCASLLTGHVHVEILVFVED
jgi:hypothetical protein